MSDREIVKDAISRAAVRYPHAGKLKTFNEAKRILKQRHGSSWFLLLRLLWPLIVELWKRK